MKICHICYGFPPAVGGTETHNYGLVKHLIKKGYDVDVIVLRPQSLSKKDIEDAKHTINKGIKVHNIYPKKFPFWIFQVKKKIKEIEKDGKIDIFDIHSSLHILPLIFKKRKIIFSQHFFELSCPLSAKKIWPRPCSIARFSKCRKCVNILDYLKWSALRKIIMGKTSRFMVKYDYLKDVLIENGIDKNKIQIVPHWIDGAKISKANMANLQKKDSKFTFLFFGRLVNPKGSDLLIEAFKQIVKLKSKSVKLIVVGDGSLREHLKKLSYSYGLSKDILFTGHIVHEKLSDYFSLADCIVFPHRYFNYEWTLLEAMYTGKPIIATDVAATKDILKNKYNSLLCEPTAESLAKKMEYALNNPSLCKKIANNALKTVKEKHSMKNLEKYEKLLEEMMNENKN